MEKTEVNITEWKGVNIKQSLVIIILEKTKGK